MRSTVIVHFLPSGLTVTAACGDTVLDAALDNGIDLQHECGGNCACTTCMVYVETDLTGAVSQCEEVEQYRLSTCEPDLQTHLSRLACQTILNKGRISVTIPPADMCCE